jgi:hypothetical protein
VGQINELKRQLFSNVAATALNDREFLPGNKLQQDIFHWLSPPDPWKNHNISRELRYSETGSWFINGNTLSEWKVSGPRTLLWIHGKRKLPFTAYSVAD